MTDIKITEVKDFDLKDGSLLTDFHMEDMLEVSLLNQWS